ncbi:hypothetical protein QYE76_065850 [Lolium multiflorum]|uniref:DUF3615 domain-containing protein n=1 Tax=Lolium multiflorum TaxID=4521 RepID=A0AAD8SBP5_LOLMU|nr:hypothetical protein QYE76_065850 [Lolium multiflorum]
MDQTPSSSTSRGPNPRSLEPEPAHLRHSFLYSDRPRGSNRSTRVEEHVREVSSREFETLILDQSPPPDSTHRVNKHDSEVSNRELEARAIHQSPPKLDSTPSIEEYALEVRALKLSQSPPTLDSTHRSEECAYDTTNSETGSEIVEEKPPKKSIPWVYRPVRFDILEALIGHSHGYSNPVQHKLDAQKLWESGKEFVAAKASESVASPTENLAQGEASTKEITENGKKWMGKEVMLAFEKYIEGKKQFKDVLYCFDEIKYQCFSVESYNHIFHHFNFTVKMKNISDDQWSLTPFFAEVKEVYGRKHSSCYKLHSYDDGHCYACKNQGMHALQHPILGIGYEGGHAAMGPPFVYFKDDDYFD